MAADDIDRVLLRDRLASAVREAGALALHMFRGRPASWIKGASSPVSEADLAVDALLRERLLAIRDAGWLSEETEDDPARLQRAEVWVVDPIDGTRAYLAGLAEWVIAAALVRFGRPLVAALYAPVSDELFLSVAGGGATLNGAPIKASAGDQLAGATFSGAKRRLDSLAAVEPRIVTAPRIPSLALRLARVATGALDGTFVAAEDVNAAVHHRLRRIDLTIAADMRISLLTRRVARIGERVLPTEIVPVVDRHADGDEGGVLSELA